MKAAPRNTEAGSVLDGLTPGQRAAAEARAAAIAAHLERAGRIRLDATSFRNRLGQGWSAEQYWQAAEIVHESGRGRIVFRKGEGIVIERGGAG
jgi:hypothetical protein